MKILYAAIICIVGFCSYKTFKPQKEIKGIKYTVYFPKLTYQGELIGYDTITKLLYFYGNQVTCNFMYHYDSLENDVPVQSEWRHFYFTFSKGAKYGLKFEKDRNKDGEKILSDSILKFHWPTINADSSIFETGNIVTFIYKRFNPDSGILTEKYELKDGKDTAINIDLILQYSNRLNFKEYSFSKKLDSLRQMQLYYCKMTVKSRYFGKENYLMDKYDVVSFFEKINVTNKEELMYYFKQGQKMDSN